VYCVVGVCDSSGKWSAKRKQLETLQVKTEREVRWPTTVPTTTSSSSSAPASLVLELDKGTAFVRVKVLERRFRKRELGCVTLDLSHYNIADRLLLLLLLCC
jgi:hypothetical protein